MDMKMGQTVIIMGVNSNGHDRQPGIITHVWGNHVALNPSQINGGSFYVCNVKVFPDCGEVRDCTSVKIFDSLATALNEPRPCSDPIFGWEEKP
jgi:hypothetical protein